MQLMEANEKALIEAGAKYAYGGLGRLVYTVTKTCEIIFGLLFVIVNDLMQLYLYIYHLPHRSRVALS